MKTKAIVVYVISFIALFFLSSLFLINHIHNLNKKEAVIVFGNSSLWVGSLKKDGSMEDIILIDKAEEQIGVHFIEKAEWTSSNLTDYELTLSYYGMTWLRPIDQNVDTIMKAKSGTRFPKGSIYFVIFKDKKVVETIFASSLQKIDDKLIFLDGRKNRLTEGNEIISSEPFAKYDYTNGVIK